MIESQPNKGTGKEQRRQEISAAALRWITNQHGPEMDPEAVYPVPDSGIFYDPGEPGERRDFLFAPDLQEIGGHLIEEFDELGHLTDYRITYLWKRKGGQRQGQAILGKCIKASGPAKHLSGSTWIIWLAADWAGHYHLTRRQIEAALFHELTHAGEQEIERTGPDGEKLTEVRPAVRGHDCEMFRGEVEHYGLWRLPLQEAAPVFQQLELFPSAAPSRTQLAMAAAEAIERTHRAAGDRSEAV